MKFALVATLLIGAATALPMATTAPVQRRGDTSGNLFAALTAAVQDITCQAATIVVDTINTTAVAGQQVGAAAGNTVGATTAVVGDPVADVGQTAGAVVAAGTAEAAGVLNQIAGYITTTVQNNCS